MSATKQRYDFNYLEKFRIEHELELEKDYSKEEKITRDTRILGKCKGDNCDKLFNTTFRPLVDFNSYYCKTCLKDVRKIKVENRNLENHGVRHAFQVKEFRNKGIETNIKKLGVPHPMQSKKIRDKVMATNILKRGVPYSSQDPSTREKFKNTCQERFGCNNPSQNEDVKQLKRETCMEHYGVEHPLQNEDIKQQIKETCQERFGCNNPSQNEHVKQLKRETCMEHYGVEHPMQDPDILQKALNAGYKYKEYKFPSGQTIQHQGYENYALDELLYNEKIPEEDILNALSDVPDIWYDGVDNKRHKYFVDIFIPSQKRCIEVKSDYTITRGRETIDLKQNACKDAGYNCEIWVYNRKGEKVECIKLSNIKIT